MKDGYRYQDGKVLVTDYSNGNERKIEIRHYQDNIDEILITENVLEKLNSEYERVIDIYNETDDSLEVKKSEIPMMLLTVVMFTLIIGGLFSLLLSMAAGIKPLITLLLFFVASLGAVFKFNIKSNIEEIKELKKQLKGEDFAIEAIEKEIEKNKKKLKELQDNISRVKLDNTCDDANNIQRGDYIQLDYVGKLKELRDYLSACYAVGYLQDYLPNAMEDFVRGNTKELNADFINIEKVKVLRKKFNDKMEDR